MRRYGKPSEPRVGISVEAPLECDGIVIEAFALLLIVVIPLFVNMMTIERAHQPNALWERVKLPGNYEMALEIIDKHLMYWPKLLVHKVKQSLTKMTQMRIRMRNLALNREKIMTLPRKETQRDAGRAATAEKAAMVEKAIEKELQERHKMGAYPRDIDYHPKPLVDNVVPDSEELEMEYVEGYDLEVEDDIEDFEALSINGPDLLDGDQAGVGEYDSEERRTTDHKRVRREYNLEPRKPEQEESSIKLKKPKVLMEVEHEDADATRRAAAPL